MKALNGRCYSCRRDAGVLPILSAWRVLRESQPGSSAIFFHLLDGNDQILAQDDRLGVPRHTWHVGDEFVQFPATTITKKLSEGHPNVVDVINNGTVNGVVNTITGGRVPLKDGFNIRRAAAERRIPCFTSLDTIRAVVEVLSTGTHTYSAQPLPSYRNQTH